MKFGVQKVEILIDGKPQKPHGNKSESKMVANICRFGESKKNFVLQSLKDLTKITSTQNTVLATEVWAAQEA